MWEVEQWGIAVPRDQGEVVRRQLLDAGLLDRSLRVRAGEDRLWLPVTGPVEGAVRTRFFARAPAPEIPRHEMVGQIAILPVDDEEEATRLLAARPSIRTVLVPEGNVEGRFRTRRFRVLAGEESTATEIREHGLVFRVDLSEVYYSARLATERKRLTDLVAPGERVLDMFAGAGPFAIALARRAGFVAACDVNPAAVAALIENCRRNRTHNVLPVLADAARLPGVLSRPFDRVVMNLPLSPLPFLPAAFALCRPGGTIHLYHLQASRGEALPAFAPFPVDGVVESRVRSYSPGRWHAVYDITVGRETVS
ncbi:MAG: methyltransferase domain-containing protein [Methanospirillum sp.]|nr:methyltransferase domain-containing protein [Methanospirillum sp.]